MTPNEFEAMLSDAEVQLTRLKHLYDQWFQGFERLEPSVPRKQFERNMFLLRRAKMRNSVLRFRLQNLVQRYTTLQTYWRRVSRQIEEGTYRRDVLRARRRRSARREEQAIRRSGRPSAPPDSVGEVIAEIDGLFPTGLTDRPPADSPRARSHTPALPYKLDPDEVYNQLPGDADPPGQRRRLRTPLMESGVDDELPPLRALDDALPPIRALPDDAPAGSSASQPQAPNPPRRRQNEAGFETRDTGSFAVPAEAASSLVGRRPKPARPKRNTPEQRVPNDDRVREIYDSYVNAKRRNNEKIDKLDFEKMAKSIKKVVPKLQREHKGSKIDFEVVVKDGRVGLKPIVKK